MFEHVTLLLSFIYVIALTHLLSTTTGLVLARDRVRFSPLLALWMVLALGILFNNWLSIWVLRSMERWSVGEVSLEFAMAIIQYFTCSLVCIEIKDEREVDMQAWYEKQRAVFLSAFACLCAMAMLIDYVHRNVAGHGGSDWIRGVAVFLFNFLLINCGHCVQGKMGAVDRGTDIAAVGSCIHQLLPSMKLPPGNFRKALAACCKCAIASSDYLARPRFAN